LNKPVGAISDDDAVIEPIDPPKPLLEKGQDNGADRTEAAPTSPPIKNSKARTLRDEFDPTPPKGHPSYNTHDAKRLREMRAKERRDAPSRLKPALEDLWQRIRWHGLTFPVSAENPNVTFEHAPAFARTEIYDPVHVKPEAVCWMDPETTWSRLADKFELCSYHPKVWRDYARECMRLDRETTGEARLRNAHALLLDEWPQTGPYKLAGVIYPTYRDIIRTFTPAAADIIAEGKSVDPILNAVWSDFTSDVHPANGAKGNEAGYIPPELPEHLVFEHFRLPHNPIRAMLDTNDSKVWREGQLRDEMRLLTQYRATLDGILAALKPIEGHKTVLRFLDHYPDIPREHAYFLRPLRLTGNLPLSRSDGCAWFAPLKRNGQQTLRLFYQPLWAWGYPLGAVQSWELLSWHIEKFDLQEIRDDIALRIAKEKTQHSEATDKKITDDAVGVDQNGEVTGSGADAIEADSQADVEPAHTSDPASDSSPALPDQSEPAVGSTEVETGDANVDDIETEATLSDPGHEPGDAQSEDAAETKQQEEFIGFVDATSS
jgi:hypothetical protein